MSPPWTGGDRYVDSGYCAHQPVIARGKSQHGNDDHAMPDCACAIVPATFNQAEEIIGIVHRSICRRSDPLAVAMAPETERQQAEIGILQGVSRRPPPPGVSRV